MAKCAYYGENIIRIEEKWIDENVKDEEEKRIRKELYKFHDLDYWKDHGDGVRNEFLKLLQRSGDKYFVGFHLPAIKLPRGC